MSDNCNPSHTYKDGKCEVCHKWENVCPCGNCQSMYTEFIAGYCLEWQCTEAEVIAHFVALDTSSTSIGKIGKEGNK